MRYTEVARGFREASRQYDLETEIIIKSFSKFMKF